MTTIIGQKIWEDIFMHSDTKVKWGYNVVTQVNKSINVGWNLIACSWDYIDTQVISEIYDEFISKNPQWLNTKMAIMLFFSMVVEVTWRKRKDINIMILNKDNQLIVADYGIENMELNEDWNWFISMWSWHIIALALYKWNNLIPMKDIYEITHELDLSTSNKFNSLKI